MRLFIGKKKEKALKLREPVHGKHDLNSLYTRLTSRQTSSIMIEWIGYQFELISSYAAFCEQLES